MATPTDTLTLDEVADQLGIHPRFITRFADPTVGALATIEVDGQRVATPEAVADFATRRKAATDVVNDAIARRDELDRQHLNEVAPITQDALTDLDDLDIRPPRYTIEDVARELTIARSHVRRLVQTGDVTVDEHGWISQDQLDELDVRMAAAKADLRERIARSHQTRAALVEDLAHQL